MDVDRPAILLLGPEWPTRALLRAQLIEEGFDVVATDVWPIPPQYLRPAMQPRLAIVDLHGLPDPRRVLEELCSMIEPARVLVVTALGTIGQEAIGRLGCRVVARPARVGEIVAAATKAMKTAP